MEQKKYVKKINYNIIKAVAGDLFLAKGYGNTSMNDIASALQIKKASLYHHIQNREQLLIDMVQDTEQKLSESLNNMHQFTELKQQKKQFLQIIKAFMLDSNQIYLLIKLTHEAPLPKITETVKNCLDHLSSELKRLLPNNQNKRCAQTEIQQLIGALLYSKIADKKSPLTKSLKLLGSLLGVEKQIAPCKTTMEIL